MSEALAKSQLIAADAIGDVIEHWGLPALGRVWTVLYREESALGRRVAERLSMSAGAVSTTLGELQRWGVVKRVAAWATPVLRGRNRLLEDDPVWSARARACVG
ncbi:MAG: hypothetical protein U0263_34895 [Polyangiaceae bacterium]